MTAVSVSSSGAAVVSREMMVWAVRVRSLASGDGGRGDILSVINLLSRPQRRKCDTILHCGVARRRAAKLKAGRAVCQTSRDDV